MPFKVLFVYSNIGMGIAFSPAVQILSAVLKRAGHETALLHLHNEHGIPNDPDEIRRFIEREKPDLIGFTATSFEYNLLNEIAGQLKRDFPGTPLILGGVHATIMSSDLASSNFDAFCIGEGEQNLLELIQKMESGEDYTDTPSFHFKAVNGGGARVIKNPIRPMVEDLDSLPFYDMEIMDTKKILLLRSKWLSIGFSRGCPYTCSFCINPALKDIKVGDGSPKKYLRKKSMEKVISELESILLKYKEYVEVFNFDDDLLMLDKKWMLDFTRNYKERIYDKYGVEYAINGRVNTIKDDLIEKMAESGCRELRIGFETGDPDLRKRVLSKPISDEQLINAFDVCHKYGIKPSAFAMLGVPQETHETVQKTLKLLARLKPYLVRMTFLTPFPHTEIYDYCKKNNLFKDRWEEIDQFTLSPLKFDSLTDEELLRYHNMFPWYLNMSMLDPHDAEKYESLIERFHSVQFLGNKELKDEILRTDDEISSKMYLEGVPHYRYFRNNLTYYQLLSPSVRQGGEEE